MKGTKKKKRDRPRTKANDDADQSPVSTEVVQRRTLKRRILLLAGWLLSNIVALILGIALSPYLEYVREVVEGSSTTIAVSEFRLYSVSNDSLPRCEVSLYVENTASDPRTVRLRQLVISDRGISCDIPQPNSTKFLEAGEADSWFLNIKSSNLAEALRVCYDSTSAVLMIRYDWDHGSDSVVFSDRELKKCSYWQTPVFESELEAKEFGAIDFVNHFEIDTQNKFTRRDSTFTFEYTVFLDKQSFYHLDPKAILGAFLHDDALLPFDSSVFFPRYGGVYVGRLVQDISSLTLSLRPVDVFGGASERTRSIILGEIFESDFWDVSEFVAFSFDASKDDSKFEKAQENSKIYVLMVSEENSRGLNATKALRSLGYRSSLELGHIQDHLDKFVHNFPMSSAKSAFVSHFNSHLDIINRTIASDGFIVFSPTILDSSTAFELYDDLKVALDVDIAFTFSNDTDSLTFFLDRAPFSTPIVVFTGFSQTTRSTGLAPM